MWPALLRIISLAGITTLMNNVHDWLQEKFGTNDGERTAWYLSPAVLLLIAAAVVLFIYKVLGKKITIR
jgi:hypothetical protein